MLSLPSPPTSSATSSFVAGAAAGLVVDVGLFPIDTIKTRLQSAGGFRANGGFRDVYKGLGVVTMGSVPGGAVFFTVYDGVCEKLLRRLGENSLDNGRLGREGDYLGRQALGVRVIAGCVAECSACLIRVPVELVKQRLQVGMHTSIWAAVMGISKEASELRAMKHGGDGSKLFVSLPNLLRVLYRGYPITIFREVPFAIVQMPLYESLKAHFRKEQPISVSPEDSSEKRQKEFNSHWNNNNLLLNAPFLKGIAPGFISGGISAVLTTPLDVTKTRIMTMKNRSEFATGGSSASSMATPTKGGVRLAFAAMRSIVRNEGVRGLFSGGATRAVWISAGGALFFGTYETVKASMDDHQLIK